MDTHQYADLGGASGQVGLGCASVAPPRGIGHVRDTLAASSDLALRVSKLVDRLAGSAPMLANGLHGARSNPSGAIPSLVAAADDAMSEVRAARAALDQLERLFDLVPEAGDAVRIS